MQVNPIILVIVGLAFTLLIYLLRESRVRAKGLLNALYEEQMLKNSLSEREQERNIEFEFTRSQTIALLNDIVKQLYKRGIVIEGVGFEYQQELAAIVHVLRELPPNYLSKNVGDFLLTVPEGEFNGLDLILSKAPGLRQVRYIDLIILIRIMISQKIGLKSAYSMWEGSN